ncbi:MAG: hypothetical protein RH860_10085 [Cytophagales bacterium]
MKYTLRYIFIALLFAACGDKVEIEQSQAETFNKLYGNAGNDSGCDIKELPNGDFLILGTIETTDKSTEIALIRTDRFGNEQWRETFGGDAEDQAGGMDIDKNGNIIIAGTTYIPGTTEEDSNHSDIIVIELDANGNLIQKEIFDQFLDNEEGNCIVYDITEIGGYIVGGSSDAISTYTEEGTNFDNPKFTKNLFFVRVYDENGIKEVNETYAGYSQDDFITSGIVYIDAFDSVNFIFSGVSIKNGLRSAVVIPVTNRNQSGFAILGITDFKFSEPSIATDIIALPNSISVLGIINPSSSSRIFIKNFNRSIDIPTSPEEGLIVIQKNGSTRGNSFLYNETNQNYIISGSTNVSEGGGFDHYIASVKQDGKINWEKTYGGTGDEEAFAIAPTKDGGFIITGYTGFEGNSLINTIKVDNKGILNP